VRTIHNADRVVKMVIISESMAFWLFALLLAVLMVFLVILGKILSPSRPNPVKTTTYECGQAPMGEAHSFMISGSFRYFAYAVVFFALDAFSWILMACSMAITLVNFTLVVIYTLIITVGILYFLKSLRRLVS